MVKNHFRLTERETVMSTLGPGCPTTVRVSAPAGSA